MIFGLFGGDKKRAAELYTAAAKGDLEGVRQALEKGADINALDPKYAETALHVAVEKSQAAVVELLLAKGANPDIVSNQYFTPLIIAAAMGDAALPMVELLIAGKANLSLAPTAGPNAGGAPLHIAASKGANAVLRRLLATGAQPTLLPNGSTLMHMAAIGGNAETVEIVAKAGISVDAPDSQSRAPLHLAALAGNAAAADGLLKLGASLECRDGEDCTPLMRAALNNQAAVVAVLLKSGANPDIVLTTGESVLSPLYAAAISGYDEVVKLLLDAGAPVAKKVGGLPSVVEMAQEAGHQSTVALLKDAVRQGKAVTSAAKTEKLVEGLQADLAEALKSLDYALVMPIKANKNFSKLPVDWQLLVHAIFGEEKLVKKMLAAGANSNMRFDDVQEGIHPLYAAACLAKDLPTVEALLAAGADVNLPLGDGRTVLMQAAGNGSRPMIERLLSAGADVNAVQPGTGLGAFGFALNRLRMDIAKILLESGAKPLYGNIETLPLAVVEHGDLELIKAIEARGGSVVPEEMKGRVAFIAARNKDGEVLDHVLAHGADVNQGNDFNYTPLTLAVLNNHVDLVKRYLVRGDDPDVADIDRETALSLAIEKAYPDIVRILCNHGAQCREYPELSDEQAMLQAALDGALGTILKLRDAGISINVEDADGNTPLMLAAQAGHLGVVRSLYHLGADVNHRNHAGMSATKQAQELNQQLILTTMKEFVADDAIPEAMRRFPGGIGGFYDAGDTMFGRMSHPYKDKPPYDNSSDEEESEPSFSDKLDELRSLLEINQVAERLGEKGREAIEGLIARHSDDPDDAPEEDRQEVEKIIEVLSQLADASDDDGNESDDGDDVIQSPLHEAINAGDLQAVKKLLKAGANPNESDGQGLTPLMAAVLPGIKEIVDLLIKEGARVDGARPDGKSPLFLAAASGNEAMVQLLVKSGASIEERYIVEHNGVEVSGCSPVYMAAMLGQLGVCKLLIKLGANIESANEAGFNPLMIAIQGGHDEVMTLLLKSGAKVDPEVECTVDAPGFGRQSPLVIAVRTENVTALKALLNAKVNVNDPAENGWTPLKSASHAGNEEIVKLLLRAGADVNIADEMNYTPLMNAVSQQHEGIAKILLKHAADPNVQSHNDDPDDNGRTALMDASVAGNGSLVRELLKAGANPNLVNAMGLTALHSAAIGGDAEVVGMLLKAGADPCVIGGEDDPKSALDVAIGLWGNEDDRESRREVLDLLLTKGVPEDRSSLMETVLLMAAGGHSEAVEIVRAHGIEVDPDHLLSNGAPVLFVLASLGDQSLDAVRVLLDLGANPNYRSPAGLPVLSLAIRSGATGVAEALLDAGADVMSRNNAGALPYDLAVIYGHLEFAHHLIEQMNTIVPEIDRQDNEGRTALMRAVLQEDVSTVQDCLAAGADATRRDMDGHSPLSYAACNHLSEMANVLRMARLEQIDIDPQDGALAIVKAAAKGALGTVLDLLDQGVPVDTVDQDGRFDVVGRAGNTALFAAEMYPGMIRLLIKRGADITHRNKEGKTVYMIAAESNRQLIMQILADLGSPLDEVSSEVGDDDTEDDELNDDEVVADGDALIGMVQFGDSRMVSRLIEAGTDINVTDDDGRTPLVIAVLMLADKSMSRRRRRDNEQIIDDLLDHGASPKVGNPSPFLLAAAFKRADLVNRMLKLGVVVNQKFEDGASALFLSLTNLDESATPLDESCAEALLNAGCDPTLRHESDAIALHMAASSGCTSIVKRLLDIRPIDIDAVDREGNTPLICAASGGHDVVAKLLMDQGSNRSLHDKDGKTAKDHALEKGYPELAALL